jgi:dipeptidyl aminopeptidase/acylaminoacyl peptidase
MARTVRVAPTGWPALLVGSLLVLLAFAGCGGDDVEIDPEPGMPRVSWGEPGDGDPAGLIMLLHGGGWQPSRAGYEEQRQNAGRLQDLGYATVAIGYSEGARGFRQIQDVYSEARRRYPDLPICASGTSAGGHLALMLATREPDLACVVDLSGPIDLRTLAEQDEEDDEAHREAVKAFGKDELAKYSPVRYADRIKAKVLMIIAEADPVNPVEQGDELERALPDAELLVLPEGPVQAPFSHFGGVTPEAQDEVVQRQLAFIQEATQGG